MFYAKKCHAQNVQVYLQPFRRNSLLKCAPQTKITKKHLKHVTFQRVVDAWRRVAQSSITSTWFELH